jgi:hypothetical protein
MANNLGSNVTRKVARIFLEKFEANRVLCKAVDTQLLTGRFNPGSGATADFKRPHDYKSIRTSGGDISSSTLSSIISGKATGTVQNYFTVAADYQNVEEALHLDQLDEILAPMATRMVTDLELDLASYMHENCGLSYGVPGTVVDTWADIAGAGSLLDSIGVPMDQKWCYAVNPFVQQTLAGLQAGLNSGSNKLVDTAWERAVISDNFAGMRVMSSNALPSRTVTTAADLVGALAANPDVTYVTAKDTMTQAWSVTGFTASATVKAGDVIQVTGKYRVSNATRLPMFDAAGAQILFQGIVTADVVLDASGEGTLVVTGPAIWETAGQYNTTSAAVVSGDVITILGTSAAVVQPNLFFHPQAFGLGTVKLPKLSAQDTIATTEDGFSIRVTKYSDGDKNQQTIRFDLLPAFATFNPFFAGQGFGLA